MAHVAPKFGESTVDVAVGTDVAEAGVNAPVVVEQAGSHFHGLAVSVVRTVGSAHHSAAVVGGSVGEHVDARAESAGAVGRSAGTALHLDVAQRRSQVGHVHPVHIVTFRIVDGHTVGGDVDARSVGAAHADAAVADAAAGIAGGHD